MIPPVRFAAAALGVACLGTAPHQQYQAPGIAALEAAGRHYDAESTGYVVDRIVEHVMAKAAFIKINRTQQFVELRRDGRIVESRRLDESNRSNVGDRTLDRQPAVNDSEGAAGMQHHFIFSARYQREYRLDPAPCRSCPDGETALSFDSDLRDAAHGAGVVRVDLKSERILSLTYRPYVLPDRRLDSGIATITFGSLGGAWVPVHYHLVFTAHAFFIHASGTADIVCTSLARYPDRGAAQTAYADMTP